MYLVGFVLFIVLGKMRARQNLLTGWHPRDVDDMLFYGVIGVILGGRLGYVLFYKPLYYLAHPLEILQLWQGGMSFHGGFLGVLARDVAVRAPARQALARGHRFRRAAGAARARRRTPRQFHQRRAVGAPDRRCRGAWCSRRSTPTPRHPSQLYQFGLEGAAALRACCGSTRGGGGRWAPPSGLFLVGYGACRFVAEYAREPDSFLGLLALGLTMGQWLSLPMIVVGIVMMVWAYRRAASRADARTT